MRQVLIAVALAVGAVGSSPAGSAEQPRTPASPASQAASAAPRATSPQAAPPAPQAAAPTLLRRLPPSSRGSRLWGEQASVSAPVYVTRRQAEANVRFRIGSLSSVSVLPESGTLTVALNGTRIRDVPLGAAYGLRLTEFDIPAGLLKEGWNSVGISAHHRHRVDCSVDAAEELWTRVDPAETGFLFPDGTARISDLSDIAAISPRPDGAVPIGIVLDAKHLLNGCHVERLGRAVQGIALAGRFAQPIVEFDSTGEAGSTSSSARSREVAGRIDRATHGQDRPARPSRSFPVARIAGRPSSSPASPTPTSILRSQSSASCSPSARDGLKTLAGANGHPINAYGQKPQLQRPRDRNPRADRRHPAHRLQRRVAARISSPPITIGRHRFVRRLCGGPRYRRTNHRRGERASAGSVRLGAAGGDNFRHKRHFLPLSAFRPGQNRSSCGSTRRTARAATIQPPPPRPRGFGSTGPAKSPSRRWRASAACPTSP